MRGQPGNLTQAYWELYNVSVWAIKTGIEPAHHGGDKPDTVPMGKYAVVGLICVGLCVVSLCGWKCWIESRDSSYEREGRRAENHARLNDTSGWEYAHEKAQSPNKYGACATCSPACCTQTLLLLLSRLRSPSVPHLTASLRVCACVGGGGRGGEAAAGRPGTGPAETAW